MEKAPRESAWDSPKMKDLLPGQLAEMGEWTKNCSVTFTREKKITTELLFPDGFKVTRTKIIVETLIIEDLPKP